jgi:hypothetical protein
MIIGGPASVVSQLAPLLLLFGDQPGVRLTKATLSEVGRTRRPKATKILGRNTGKS